MTGPSREIRRFIPHPQAERFDRVTLDTVERWKDSDLSGDEWRFSYIAEFWRHGYVAARLTSSSIEGLLLRCAAKYPQMGYEDRGDEHCCQPGCGDPWVVLLHPIKAYDRRGGELVRPYNPGEVRGFCERHRHRGDCGLDDSDRNYEVVEERFPQAWVDQDGGS